MHSLRAAVLGLLTILASVAAANAKDRSTHQPAQGKGAHTIGLFSFGFDQPPTRQVAHAAEEPRIMSHPALAASLRSSSGEQQPVVQTQGTAPPIGTAPTIVDSTEEIPPTVTAEDDFDPTVARSYESVWYTRIDYFQWQEVHNGERFMQNDGVAPTVGWQQRRGQQRYRFDFFGARPNYDATIEGQVVENVTDYLGLRGEYELLWEPQRTPFHTLFAGVGTRYFVRSFPDLLVNNHLYFGYQEAWWTFYPYLGIERKRTLRPGRELYSMVRFGMTAFTREHITHGDATLFPRPNLTYQSELGIRGPRLSVACFAEYMAWSLSPQVLNYSDGQLYHLRQPESLLLTLGGRIAWSY